MIRAMLPSIKPRASRNHKFSFFSITLMGTCITGIIANLSGTERVGFEPTRPQRGHGFRDRCLEPLGYLSSLNYRAPVYYTLERRKSHAVDLAGTKGDEGLSMKRGVVALVVGKSVLRKILIVFAHQIIAKHFG